MLGINSTLIQRFSSIRSKTVYHGPMGPQNLSFVERSNVLCPLFIGSFKKDCTISIL